MSKLSELLRLVNANHLKDMTLLKDSSFCYIPDQEWELVLSILQSAAKGETFDEEHFVNDVLSQVERDKWVRTKNRMVSMLYQYYGMKEFGQSTVKRLLLARLFAKEGLHDNLNGILRKKKNPKNRIPVFSGALMRFFMNEIAAQKGKHIRRAKTAAAPIDEMQAGLDEFYLENKLRCLCEQVNRNNVIKVGFAVDDELMRFVESKTDNTCIQAYYSTAKMLQFDSPDSEKHYSNLRKLLLHKPENIDPNREKELLDYLMNYNIHKANLGDMEHSVHYREHVSLLIENGLWLEEGELSPVRFKNCVTVGLYTDDFEWVEGFVKQQAAFLPEKDRENAEKMSIAGIECHKGNYDACLLTLATYEPRDVYDHMTRNKLVLKCHFLEAYNNGRYLTGKGYTPQRYRTLVYSFKDFANRQKELSKQKREAQLDFSEALLGLVGGKGIKGGLQKGNMSTLDYLWLCKMQQKMKPQ